jgi:hypothetical protein
VVTERLKARFSTLFRKSESSCSVAKGQNAAVAGKKGQFCPFWTHFPAAVCGTANYGIALTPFRRAISVVAVR